jgi:predicted AlkP superfamily pyrophosphatase or phosphodiesterase
MRSRALLPAVLLLCATGAQAQSRPRVLLIGIDGVRPDLMMSANTPRIHALAREGFYTDSALTGTRTVSGPGWSNMLTGVWPEKHGVLTNDFRGNALSKYPDFLTRLEQLNPALRTISITDWPPLATSADGGPLLSAAIDERVTFDGEALGWAVADSMSAARAAAELRQGDPDALFVYLGNADETGHDHGSLGPEYRTALELSDVHVGWIMDALRSRPGFAREDWLVLLSTDHSRRDDGGHGLPTLRERTIFILAWGAAVDMAGAPRKPQLVDIAVTALTHMGVAILPSWGLDGHAVALRRR